MNFDVIETRVSKIWVADGIRYDEIKDGGMITLDDAQQIVSAYFKSSQGQPLPHVFDFSKLKSLTREARDFFASKTCAVAISAMAIITGAPITEVTANLFITLNKPSFPVKVFSNREEAVSWLKSV